MNILIMSLFLVTLMTGLMAGVFFTWSNAVKPGIACLADIEYLRAFQAMNRVILNPVFYIVFFIPVLSLLLLTVLLYNSAIPWVFELALLACGVYLPGVFLLTVLSNIPLNNRLNEQNLDEFNSAAARTLRNDIELKWNSYNLIRSITASFSFMLLIIICLLVGE